MEYNDVEKLFSLLEHLYQGKKKSRDKVTVAIWHEVFKPWSYEQVRDAVIRRSREKKFMPDQSEIAEYLPRAERMGEKVPGTVDQVAGTVARGPAKARPSTDARGIGARNVPSGMEGNVDRSWSVEIEDESRYKRIDLAGRYGSKRGSRST